MNGATNSYNLIFPKPHSEWNIENPKPICPKSKNSIK